MDILVAYLFGLGLGTWLGLQAGVAMSASGSSCSASSRCSGRPPRRLLQRQQRRLMLTHTRKGSGRAVIFKRLESQRAQSYVHHAIQLDEGEPWQAAIELLMQADPDHWELYETDNPDAATFLNLCKDAFHEKKADSPWPSRTGAGRSD
jgi:hypothetical protein